MMYILVKRMTYNCKNHQPSPTSKSLKASSEPESSSSTSPLRVNIMVCSFKSTMQPTTSPACQARPKCSLPWCQRCTWKSWSPTKLTMWQKLELHALQSIWLLILWTVGGTLPTRTIYTTMLKCYFCHFLRVQPIFMWLALITWTEHIQIYVNKTRKWVEDRPG